MELITDRLMTTAMLHLKHLDSQQGQITTKQALALKKELGVSDIFITNKDGEFVVVTNGPIPPDQPTLFSFCPDYRNLTYGNMTSAYTPIVSTLPEGKGTYKFLMVPNHDRTRILEIGMELDFIARVLQQSAANHPELKSIGLFTPSGKSLGEYPKSNTAQSANININTDYSLIDDGTYLTFSRKIYANVKNCCECQVKGLTSSNSDAYFYVLRAQISKENITSAIDKLKTTIALIALAITILSILLANLIAKKVLSNLTIFGKNLEAYLNGKIKANEVALNSSDEIGFISRTFVEMLKNWNP